MTTAPGQSPYDDIRNAMKLMDAYPPPEGREPIKLTAEQLDVVPRATPDPYGGTLGSLFGTPEALVETVQELTPYLLAARAQRSPDEES
jgi:hypothetical protein